MWLTLASIVLASAITLNILALWLSGYFERKQLPQRPLEFRRLHES
jgi:hypothetical protein